MVSVAIHCAAKNRQLLTVTLFGKVTYRLAGVAERGGWTGVLILVGSQTELLFEASGKTTGRVITAG